MASTSECLDRKWLKTVARATPHLAAISVTVTSSKPCSAKSSRAASRMRARCSARFLSRFDMDPMEARFWTQVQT